MDVEPLAVPIGTPLSVTLALRQSDISSAFSSHALYLPSSTNPVKELPGLGGIITLLDKNQRAQALYCVGLGGCARRRVVRCLRYYPVYKLALYSSYKTELQNRL